MIRNYTISLDGIDVTLKIDSSIEINTVFYPNGGQPHSFIAIRPYVYKHRNVIQFSYINLMYVT